MAGIEKKDIEYPVPDFQGVSGEEVFLKATALFGVYDRAVGLEIGLPVIPENEQIGLRMIGEEILGDLELLIYGKRPWTDSKYRKGDKEDD